MPGLKQRDVRQLRFQSFYANPKSRTFTNAYQSALKAGYSISYAKQITHQSQKIVSEALAIHKAMLAKAERNLEEMLSVNENEPVMTAFGPIKDRATGQSIMRLNTKILAIKVDVSKFVLERLDRKRFGHKEDLSDEGQTEPRPILMQFNTHLNGETKES